MKKNTGRFFVILAVCAVLTLSSCIVNGEKEEITAPTTFVIDKKHVTVSFNSISGMSYANIFRESSETTGFSTIKERTNIGQVNPKDSGSLPNSFNFIDSHLEDNLNYRYFIRYYKDQYYAYTGYSPVISATAAEGEAVLKESDGDPYTDTNKPEVLFINNLVNMVFTLSLRTGVLLPDGFKTLWYVIDSGSAVKPFKFADADDDNKVLEETADTPDLRVFLLHDFLGKTNYVRGIIGVEETQPENENYTTYYWTKPQEIALSARTTAERGKPPIDEERPEKNIYVPPIADNTNDFDYNPSTKLLAPMAEFMLSAESGVELDLTPCN